jgi:hypothetical protein
VDKVLPFDPLVETTFRFPLSEGAGIAMVHAAGRVLETRYDAEFCELRAEVPESLMKRLSEFRT